MSKFELIECNKPKIKKINFVCDVELHKKLNKYPLFEKCFNKQNTSLFVGLQGSGKTSLVINFLSNKDLYRYCFHNIYLFMRESSINSLKDNIFKDLPDEQKFEDLTLNNIEYVYNKIKEDALNEEYNLIIFDDVQDALKDYEIAKVLNKMIANQRHLRLVNIIILQNYFALDSKIRRLVNNIVLFKLDKIQMEQIFKEVIEQKHKTYDDLIDFVYKNPHDWICINKNKQLIFKEFDLIKI